MPSSVLLAILVGAGVLALMPALIRRYDSAIRRQQELQTSSMRLLRRRKSSRTIPTPPLNKPDPAQQEVKPDKPRSRSDRGLVQPAHSAPRITRRRRWIVGILVLIIVATGMAGPLVHRMLWAAPPVVAVTLISYLRRVRKVVAQAALRRARVTAETTIRRQHAMNFVAAVRAESNVSTEAAQLVTRWLTAPPARRPEPSVAVTRVLAAAGREPYQSRDGWRVRVIIRPRLVPPAPDVVAPVVRPAARRDAVFDQHAASGLPRAASF